MTKKFSKMILAIITILLLICSSTSVYAVPEPPNGGQIPEGNVIQNGNGAPSESSVEPTYTGALIISSDEISTDAEYSSITGGENVLLVNGGTSTISNATVTKLGDTDDENSDFYGTNAAILTYNGATLNLIGGKVITNGSHANAVFAYGTGVINLSNVTIRTVENN